LFCNVYSINNGRFTGTVAFHLLSETKHTYFMSYCTKVSVMLYMFCACFIPDILCTEDIPRSRTAYRQACYLLRIRSMHLWIMRINNSSNNSYRYVLYKRHDFCPADRLILNTTHVGNGLLLD